MAVTNKELLFILKMRNDASRVLQNAGTGFKKMGREADIAGRKVKAVTNNFAKMRSQVSILSTLIGGLGFAFIFRGVARATIKFETSMSRIIGLVGVARKQVQGWEKDILALAPATGKGPGELAEAMFFITSAGLRGAAALDALEKSAKAASAGLGDTVVVADALTSALNAYAKSGLDAGTATGILVAAVREGKLEASQLAPVLGTLLGVASELGVTFDQVAATIAALSRTGQNAAEGATALRSILSSLLKPTTDVEKALAEMGTSSKELRDLLRTGGVLAVLKDLRARMVDNADAIARIFPNVRALRGVLGLVGQQVEATTAIFKSLAEATVEDLNEAFLVATETIDFKFGVAMAKMEVNMIRLGSEVIPPLVAGLGLLIDNMILLATIIGVLVGRKLLGLLVTSLIQAGIATTTVVGITTVATTRFILFRASVLGVVKGLRALTIALLASPIGILTLLAIGFAALFDELRANDRLMDDTAKNLKDIKAALDAFAQSESADAAAAALKKVGDGLAVIEAQIATLQRNQTLSTTPFDVLLGRLLGPSEATQKFNKQIADLKKQLVDTNTLLDQFKVTKARLAVEAGVTAFEFAGKTAGDTATPLDKDIKKLQLAIANTRAQIEAFRTDGLEGLLDVEALQDAEAAIKKIEDAGRKAGISIENLAAILIETGKVEKELNNIRSEAARIVKEEGAARLKFAKFAEEARAAEVEQLIAFIDGVESMTQSLKDEIRLVGLSEKAHRRETIAIQLEALAREGNITNIKEQRIELGKLLDVLEAAEAQGSTFQDGITRAFKRMGDEIADVATRADEAFTQTFNNLSDVINDFVLTGTADLQGFFRELNSLLVGEATKDLLGLLSGRITTDQTFFGGLIDTLGGLFGGGGTEGAVVSKPDGTKARPLHVKIENLDITSLPGLPQFLPKVGPGEESPGNILDGDGSDIILDNLDTGFGGIFSKLGDVVASLTEGFGDILSSIGSAVGSILSALAGSGGDVVSGITDIVGGIFGLFGGAGGGAGAAAGSSALTNPFLNIGGLAKGGIVGRDAGLPKLVRAELFRHARSMRTGGLTSNEVPIIAHKGEAVVPLSGGRSIPVEIKQGGRQGPSPAPISITMNNNFTDVRGLRQSVDQIAADVVRAVDIVRARNV